MQKRWNTIPYGFLLSLTGILFTLTGYSQTSSNNLRGFTDRNAAHQQELEKQFDSGIQSEHFPAWMQQLSARPHHAGSPHGKANAEFMAGLFRSWGYQTRIDEFKILFPSPRIRRLELIAPTPYTAKLKEPPLHSSWPANEQLPPYNAYSIDGDVSGELVYVNYGVPEDYEELQKQGIDVKGRIVIARYGQVWRGIKPRIAADHGAIGCIIYSDPELDGYSQGDVYPEGAYRPEQSVQLGSVLDLTAYPGDPLTPFEGATETGKRLPREKAASLTRIPVLPISYGDALPFLKAMRGPVAPESWRGTLPIPYHLGPGPAKVHLQLAFDWNLVPAYDVIAVLEGEEFPDEWILHGNHHDAWILGATDPVSAMAALLEEARGIAELARNGNRPKRTIIYAAWDAEEPGFIGSTEWAETNADELRRKAAVYVNTDSNARGFLQMSGSFTLQRFLNQVARDVIDPQSGVSVLDRGLAQLQINGAPPGEPTVSRDLQKQTEHSDELILEPLGSGSDFTAFLDHLGIATLDFSYCCDSDYGVYHSQYDSFEHYKRFVDPKFEYETTLVQTSGRVLLRLANADVLPFEFVVFANRIGSIVEETIQTTDQMRQQTIQQNEWIEKNYYKIIADTRRQFIQPEEKTTVPVLNFAPLQNAVKSLKLSAQHYETAMDRFSERNPDLSKQASMQLNKALMETERALTRPDGLPGRSWYRHYVYAPGTYTGYSAIVLPTVRESIEQRDFSSAETQIAIAAEVLNRFAAQVDQATALLTAAFK